MLLIKELELTTVDTRVYKMELFTKCEWERFYLRPVVTLILSVEIDLQMLTMLFLV